MADQRDESGHNNGQGGDRVQRTQDEMDGMFATLSSFVVCKLC